MSSPIAPGPVTTTTSPASDGLRSITAWTAIDSGSVSAPAFSDTPSGSRWTASSGMATKSASAPSAVVPMPLR